MTLSADTTFSTPGNAAIGGNTAVGGKVTVTGGVAMFGTAAPVAQLTALTARVVPTIIDTDLPSLSAPDLAILNAEIADIAAIKLALKAIGIIA